ncbi:phosphotransferase [Streptomyces sp. NPDC012746]|uniref:protein kinase domain-containing protein n=1 Tax=Streptomyces sp. NPDC012746 TaxID=3364845 RepID=UPI00368E9771
MTENGGGDLSAHTLAGFRLRRALSVTGCHAVYQAEDDAGRPVAIRSVCLDAEASIHRRLDNELACLNHLAGVGVAPAVLATGTTETLRFVAGEWLPGMPWRSRVHRARSLADAGRLVPAAAGALSALHGAGVVHGDLHAYNIVVSGDDVVRFIDFESSVIPEKPEASRGVNPKIAWRLAAPELFAFTPGGHRPRPTPASDQYSLAALFYRWLVGRHLRPPQENPDDPSPATDPAPLTGATADRWPTLPQTLATALADDPADRYPTTADFADAFRRAMTPANGRPRQRDSEHLPTLGKSSSGVTGGRARG